MSIQFTRERDGALARIVLRNPKANVLDAGMITAIRAQLADLDTIGLKVLVFEGEGRHFSFGASVEEHLPAQVADMLPRFHAMFRELEATGVPTAAVVRGQCLGGGCELAMACGRVFTVPRARFALPEITLGVFPPLGTVLLPMRVGLSRATQAVLSGAAISGEEAARIGLADDCSDNPEAAMQQWFDETVAPRSAVALQHAWRALRRPVVRAYAEDLPAVEALYLDELMDHRDPVEGLEAFLQKRSPTWSHA